MVYVPLTPADSTGHLEEAKFRHFLCPPLLCDGVPQACIGVTSRGIPSTNFHEIQRKSSQPSLCLSSQQGLGLRGEQLTPFKPDFPAALVIKDASNCHLCCCQVRSLSPGAWDFLLSTLTFQVSSHFSVHRHRFPHLHLTIQL